MIYTGTEEALNAEMERMTDFLRDQGIEQNFDQWDVVKQAPDGTYFIYSPDGQPRFEGYTHSEHVDEIEMPDAWIPKEEQS